MNEIKLPDFDDMLKSIDNIYELMKRKSLLDIEIKLQEANVTAEATSNEKYFQNNKPPSQTYIDNSWKYTGFDNELIPLRKELAEVTAKLEFEKMRYYFYSNIIDVWRTQEANKRVAVS